MFKRIIVWASGILRINKFFLFILLGFVVYAIFGFALVAARAPHFMAHKDDLIDSLATNFISDFIFFALVGAAGVGAQFYGEYGDVLDERLRRVFANKGVTLPVLEFFEDVLRANSVFAELAEHEIDITDFSEELRAYRGTFTNTYKLRNAFGDVPYDAELSVEVAPDYVNDALPVLAEVETLKLSVEGGSEIHYVSSPTPVSREGFRQPIRITLPPNGKAAFQMRWWSWIATMGNSGFSQKRFAERFVVRVVNSSAIPVKISHTEHGSAVTIHPGQSYLVREVINVPPRTRVEFFWRSPDDKADMRPLETALSALEFDQRLGEKRVDRL